MSLTSDTDSLVSHGDLMQEPVGESPAYVTTTFLDSAPKPGPLCRSDTAEGLTSAERPRALLLTAPPRSVARPSTPPSEHPSMGGLEEPLDGPAGGAPAPSAGRCWNSRTLESGPSAVGRGSGSEHPQLVHTTKEPAASEEEETGIVERVGRLCAGASAEELEAIAQMSLAKIRAKRISATPPSQGPPAPGVNPMPHPLGGVHPGYHWFPLGVPPLSVPQVAPDPQMPPHGMMPWAPNPPPVCPGYANPVAPAQQQKKGKGQCRQGQEYEPHPAAQKALEGVPENERTTLMLRNIPLNYSRDQVECLLNSFGFKGKYDLLYLPRDFDRGANLGYAFINFPEHADADRARKELHQFRHWGGRSVKRAVVDWAASQGRERNLERWKTSSVMSREVEESARPMCYDGDGNKAPGLLAADKEPRRPRPRRNSTSGAATKSEPQPPVCAYSSYPYPPYGMPAPGMWPGMH